MEPRVRSRMRPRRHNGGGTRRFRKRLIGVLIAAASLLVLPASAQADLSLTGSHAEPTDTQAGAHSDFNIHAQFGSEDVNDLTISLPPGQVGNPLATPQCDPSLLPNCPANTAVGAVSSSVTISGLITQTINGTVYNLVPNTGEPARFGIVLNALPITLPPPIGSIVLPPTVVQSGASLRSDFGLDTVVKGTPNTAVVIPGVLTVPIHINSLDLTLNGIASTGTPFMRNPTSCGNHVVRFSGNSHQSPTVVSVPSPAFTTTGCENLDFSPAFTAQVGGPGQTTNGVPTTASTAILQDNEEAGLRDAVVRVPNDLNPNATIFFGPPCSEPDFVAGTCPSNTVVGLATAASPLLSQPLIGNVSLVSSGGQFPNLGLDLKGQLHLLLQGSIDIAGGNTVTFNNLPDIPISRFQLTFTPSPGLLGTSRDICVPPPPLFHADFTGWNGATRPVDAAATVDGCGPPKPICKKAKKKKKKGKQRAAEAKKKKGKKKGKKKCPKKKKKKGKKKKR
jgi:hypothetical protein